MAITVGVLVVMATGLSIGLAATGRSEQSAPVLASAATTASGQPVDDIPCDTNEQLAYHRHAHLAVYVNGRPREVPAGIGIVFGPQTASSQPLLFPGPCIYWLHSHAADGIIHVESPVEATFTLGQYFDIWGQPLDGGRVGPATGPVTTYVNGRVWTGSPRDVPLTSHAVIQLDVGRVAAPRPFRFPAGL